ncbi:MAG: bifunctional phosphoglucose/phosphomannose isomerase [Bacteroidota bacterium]|nr:bifunctional phosphoglucose/phosphomannose isomerase [Bacteroidota bacterium]
MSEITHELSLENFYYQIQYSLSNYHHHQFRSSSYNNIVIAGLGGSGIGGRIAKTYFIDKSNLPIEVFSDYNLPKYVSSKSLVILCSYSGTTEETISMFHQAKRIGAQLICITSGGELFDLAKENNVPTYVVEKGYQPRMALGFSLTFNLLILGELFGINVNDELIDLSKLYDKKEEYKSIAKGVISNNKDLNNKFTIVSDNFTEAIGIRFCQQLQENAKTEAFINVLPEANHNVFETYYGKLPSHFIFLNSHTNERNDGRFAYLKKLLESYGNQISDLSLSNGSLYELFKFIYISDWISIYLSNEKGVDNMSVPNIMKLKDFLKTF